MKPIGLLLLILAIALIRPDGSGARSLIEWAGFRIWIWIGLMLTLLLICLSFRESLKGK